MDKTQQTHLNLRLLVRSRLLLPDRDLLVLLIMVVRHVDTHTKLVPELVDPSALSTDNATNVFPLDVELGGLYVTIRTSAASSQNLIFSLT